MPVEVGKLDRQNGVAQHRCHPHDVGWNAPEPGGHGRVEEIAGDLLGPLETLMMACARADVGWTGPAPIAYATLRGSSQWTYKGVLWILG